MLFVEGSAAAPAAERVRLSVPLTIMEAVESANLRDTNVWDTHPKDVVPMYR